MNLLKLFDTKYTLENQDENGNTVLHNAIYKRNWRLINKIIKQIKEENKTEVLNIQNDDGDIPLHICVRRLPLNPLSNELIALGSDCNIKNNKGEFIKIADTMGKYFEYVKYDLNLKDLESDSEEECENEQSPIHITFVNINKSSNNVYNNDNDDDDDDDDDDDNKKFLNNSIDFPVNLTFEEPMTPTLASDVDVQSVVKNPFIIKKSSIMQPRLTDEGEKINIIKNNQFNVPSKTSISSFIDKLIQENK